MHSERLGRASLLLVVAVLVGCGGSDAAVDAGTTGDATADVTEAGTSDSTDSGHPEAAASTPDASDAASTSNADAEATAEASAPWTPSTLGAQLAFWFDPTSLVAVAGSVAKWSDLSRNGNDALQPTVGYEPTYTVSGIGGLPSATFGGPITYLTIADNPTLDWATSDFAIFVVVRATSQTASSAMLYQKVLPVSPYDGATLYLNANKPTTSNLAAAQISGAVYALSTAPPATYVDFTVHLLGMRRAGATLEMRVDGAASGTLTSAAVATTSVSNTAYVTIGQNGYPPQSEFQQLHGDIAEMVGVRETLSAADLQSLEHYLKTRYGIP
jgi:hypothetical protein